ncbi:hypothetical protein Nepgr_031751 [Nepenthes gracilis]|uniref:Uncharacterized protein n=1 Tax=Nepenthes gracilis TaxID=150966 RepID=A0AAD3Y5D9_NEPGR|nr:hypothetical protein Nepgr_031751 [Nepenthes gracilis]
MRQRKGKLLQSNNCTKQSRSQTLAASEASVHDPSIPPEHQHGHLSIGPEEVGLHVGIVAQARSSPTLDTVRPHDGSDCSTVEVPARVPEVPRINGLVDDPGPSSCESPLDPLSSGPASDGYDSIGLDFVDDADFNSEALGYSAARVVLGVAVLHCLTCLWSMLTMGIWMIPVFWLLLLEWVVLLPGSPTAAADYAGSNSLDPAGVGVDCVWSECGGGVSVDAVAEMVFPSLCEERWMQAFGRHFGKFGCPCSWQILEGCGCIRCSCSLADDGVLISSGMSKLGLLMLYWLMYGTCWQYAGLLGAGCMLLMLKLLRLLAVGAVVAEAEKL